MMASAPWRIGRSARLGPNYNLPWVRYDPLGRADGAVGILGRHADGTRACRQGKAGRAGDDRGAARPLPAARADRGARSHGTMPSPTRCARLPGASAAISMSTTIFVEAILNRTPWKMWDLATGGRRRGRRHHRGRREASRSRARHGARIRAAMRHPGILHLYVHLMEMSPFPGAGAEGRRRFANIGAGCRPSNSHADTYRCALRPLSQTSLSTISGASRRTGNITTGPGRLRSEFFTRPTGFIIIISPFMARCSSGNTNRRWPPPRS